MSIAKPIFMTPPAPQRQQPVLSSLSKSALEEIHAASTRYPEQDCHVANTLSSLNRHSSEQKVPSSTTSTDSFDDTEKTGEQKSKTSTVNSEREDSLDSKKNDSSSTVNNDQSGEQDSVELKEKMIRNLQGSEPCPSCCQPTGKTNAKLTKRVMMLWCLIV